MTGDPNEDRLPEPLTFTVTVDEMLRTYPAIAKVVLKGSDDDRLCPSTYVTIELKTLPHRARAMRFSSKWKVTMEQID